MPVQVPVQVNPSKKLAGYDFYRAVLGSPKFVVAPMVDQSELPWRILSRRYGAQVVYTPMINVKMWATSGNKKYKSENFNISLGEEGGSQDRPLVVQLCGNDPELFLAAAKDIEPYCDAVDINLGCPQDIARRGRYGAFLQDDWDLVYKIINILHVNLTIPVTAKFRVFPTVEATAKYAQMLESAGAQILTCHGRTREQRGHNSGLADWDKIRAVKEAVSVPVFANGNVLYQSDIQRCLDTTHADGVMSAEGNLYNPAIFHTANPNPRHADIALEYIEIVRSLKTPTAPGAIKGHLFKLFRPALDKHKDLRDRLGKIHGKPEESLDEYEQLAREMKERMDREAEEASADDSAPLIVHENGTQDIPHWRAQPYFRPPPPAKKPVSLEKLPAKINGSVEDLKKAAGVDGSVPDRKRGSEQVVSDGEDDAKRARR